VRSSRVDREKTTVTPDPNDSIPLDLTTARSKEANNTRALPDAVRNQKGESGMKTFLAKVRNFLAKEDGPTAVEYAVMLALIIVVCVAAISALGSNASNTFNNVSLNTAAGS
jgi:pilus assembly protein Flp/PilA